MLTINIAFGAVETIMSNISRGRRPSHSLRILWSIRPSIKSGTWNIPEHSGTSNNYDNYEKTCVKLNFELAHATIWSAHIGQVTCFFSRTEQLCLEMNAYGRTFHCGKSIEKYDVKVFGVEAGMFQQSTTQEGSKYKVSGVTVSNVWKTFCQTGEKSLFMLTLGVNRKGR